jgi:winged helix DNA-binding protein
METQTIVTERLHNQNVWGDPLATPEAVVSRMAAIQAQEFAYAMWSVAQRANGASLTAIDQAFATGAILRTHVIRPTWHFVAATDVRWILQVSAPRVHALNAYYYRQLGVDAPLCVRTNKLFAKVLQGGRQLTRSDMAAVLERAGISASGTRLAYVLMRAELDGVICSGALRGRQHTYALLDERAPQANALSRDDALAELTRRYFVSRGPATLKDYLGWSSLTAREGTNGLDMIKEQLEHEVVNGRTYWFASSPATRRPNFPVVDLLQGYDEYVMSYSESRDVLFTPGLPSARPLDRAAYYHAVMLDGRLIGHWRHRLEKDRVVIETQLARALGAAETRAFDSAVMRYGRFLGLPVIVRPEPVG